MPSAPYNIATWNTFSADSWTYCSRWKGMSFVKSARTQLILYARMTKMHYQQRHAAHVVCCNRQSIEINQKTGLLQVCWRCGGRREWYANSDKWKKLQFIQTLTATCSDSYIENSKNQTNQHHMAQMWMCCWVISPFLIFAVFDVWTLYVAVNILYKLQFFTFVFAVLLPILVQFWYHSTFRKHQCFCLFTVQLT